MHKNNATTLQLAGNQYYRAESIKVVSVSGNHQSMMSKPHIISLGKSISEKINDGKKNAYKYANTDHKQLATLQESRTNGAKIVYIPGAGDSVTSILDFLKTLDNDLSFYGMQPRGLENSSKPPHATVGIAAHHYLSELKAIVNDQPLHLIGHSFGGWIALEMALILQNAGNPAASIMVIDSEPFTTSSSYTRTDVLVEFLNALELTSGQDLSIDKGYIDNLSDHDQLVLLHSSMVKLKLIPHTTRPDLLVGSLRTFAAGLRATYQPKNILQQPLQFILCDDSRKSETINRKNHKEQLLAWQPVVPNLITKKSTGNHFTALKVPFVEDLVSSWKEWNSYE